MQFSFYQFQDKNTLRYEGIETTASNRFFFDRAAIQRHVKINKHFMQPLPQGAFPRL